MKRRAFTLIELLVVVAIISILASMAIPNFIEAQTRAKVARAASDIRVIAGALEAYHVDWNSYPFNNDLRSNADSRGTSATQLVGIKPGIWGGFQQLTTPVAYLTAIPLDPFGLSGSADGRSLEMGTRAEFTPVFDAGHAPWAGATTESIQQLPTQHWIVESRGPDRKDDTGPRRRIPIDDEQREETTYFDFRTEAYPHWLVRDKETNDPVEVLSDHESQYLYHLVYDPTNGVASAGQVLRTGGVAPPDTHVRAFAQFCNR